LTSSRLVSVYLDANAIIQSIETDGAPLAMLMSHVERGGVSLFTSELSLAEVLVRPLKEGQDQLVELYERLLAPQERLSVLPISRAILRSSAEIRAMLGNKGPDAIHVATARATSCTLFVSSDTRLRLPDGMTRMEPAGVAQWEPSA